MTGPYQIRFTRRYGGEILATFDAHEVAADETIRRTAERFRALDLCTPGGGPLQTAERASAVLAATLLEPGEELSAEIVGRVGDRDDVICRSNRCARDEAGRFSSTIGSRFNERVFRGL